MPWHMCRGQRTVCRVSSLLPPETELRSSCLVERALPIDLSQQPEVSVQMLSPLSLCDLCADKGPPRPSNTLFLYPVHCDYSIKVEYSLSK